MTDANAGGSESALRSFRPAQEEAAVLSVGGLPPDEMRGRILRLANSVDRTLRRLLRDDERADLSVRLKALAPDELSGDMVLAELRRNERLPLDLAAGVHELLEIRRRLEGGGPPDAADPARAISVVDRLDAEVRQLPRPPLVHEVPLPDDAFDHTIEAPVRRRGSRFRSTPAWPVAAAIVLVIAAALGVRALTTRGPDQMEQGIALFRTGAYADAANHFWRYAEANPEDATPHLYLARIHRRMNRPELAAEAIREAQQRAPQDPAVHRELGFLLLDTGQPEVAMTRFRQAIDLDPASSEAWVGLVRALRESGRTDEVERAIADAPAEVRALLTRPATN